MVESLVSSKISNLDREEEQKLYDGYASALSKAWESYIKIIDLLIGLASATALVFLSSIKVSDWTNLPNRHLIVYIFAFSAASLVCAAFWRFASQHFMEYETLGSQHAAQIYFGHAGIEPVTRTHIQTHKLRQFYRRCFRILPLPMGLFLLCAWASIFLVFFGNAPKP
jgi:hypothetical protein